jgi:hypothetical protein
MGSLFQCFVSLLFSSGCLCRNGRPSNNVELSSLTLQSTVLRVVSAAGSMEFLVTGVKDDEWAYCSIGTNVASSLCPDSYADRTGLDCFKNSDPGTVVIEFFGQCIPVTTAIVTSANYALLAGTVICFLSCLCDVLSLVLSVNQIAEIVSSWTTSRVLFGISLSDLHLQLYNPALRAFVNRSPSLS